MWPMWRRLLCVQQQTGIRLRTMRLQRQHRRERGGQLRQLNRQVSALHPQHDRRPMWLMSARSLGRRVERAQVSRMCLFTTGRHQRQMQPQRRRMRMPTERDRTRMQSVSGHLLAVGIGRGLRGLQMQPARFNWSHMRSIERSVQVSTWRAGSQVWPVHAWAFRLLDGGLPQVWMPPRRLAECPMRWAWQMQVQDQHSWRQVWSMPEKLFQLYIGLYAGINNLSYFSSFRSMVWIGGNQIDFARSSFIQVFNYWQLCV